MRVIKVSGTSKLQFFSSIGYRQYNGSIEVKHLLSVLHDDIGIPKIKQDIKKSLDGMKLACAHADATLLRPQLIHIL